MNRRNWSKEEKLAILKEAEQHGVKVTIRKHGIYPLTYYNWRKKFRLEGEAGFADQARQRKGRQYILQLKDEVFLLNQLFTTTLKGF